ncbi:MAG: flagellar hook-basal body protein [Verrucomicrobiota bacterium]|jgi:flagellar basal-body rod protein FlgF
MNVSLYQAASALNATTRWQELIAENLASSSIPGFKKQELSFAAVESGLMSKANDPAQAAKFTMPRVRAVTNFQTGDMKYTGTKTDVALEGRGFFEVQLPNGALAYTRDGEFRLNAQGVLVTKGGFPVLGTNGTIQFDPRNPQPFSISATGEVSQGAENRGQIKVVDFNNPQLLTPTGAGYFLANDPGLQVTEVETPNLRQGYLESANTSPVQEMSNLISAMRHFEANQRIIQMQDERMSKAIHELGSPS